MTTKVSVGDAGAEVVIDAITDCAYLLVRPAARAALSASVATSADELRQIGEAALAAARVLEARARKAAPK